MRKLKTYASGLCIKVRSNIGGPAKNFFIEAVEFGRLHYGDSFYMKWNDREFYVMDFIRIIDRDNYEIYVDSMKIVGRFQLAVLEATNKREVV